MARMKRACMLVACVVVCSKALKDPLERLPSEDPFEPTEGTPLSSDIATRIKREVVQPALVMAAASATYFVLLPAATIGLPAAASVSLIGSGVAAIGVSFLLSRGGGGDEDASASLGRSADDTSAACDRKIKRLQKAFKREKAKVEKAKEDATKAKLEAKKAKAETAATRTKMVNMQGALDDAKNMCQAPRNATTML